jgi:hypothetical protein
MSVRLDLVTERKNPKDQYNTVVLKETEKTIVSEGYRLGHIESKRDDDKQIPKIEETE